MKRILHVLSEEIHGLRPRLRLMNACLRLLPEGMFPRLRASVCRAFGLHLGQGTMLFAGIRFGWYGSVFSHLRVGNQCFFSHSVFIDTTAPVTVGDGVSFGHDVSIITANHDPSDPRFRAGRVLPKPVRIGNGVWIGAHAKILPGVTIGNGCIIAAGAVVSRDIPDDMLAAGVPARPIRSLPNLERNILSHAA